MRARLGAMGTAQRPLQERPSQRSWARKLLDDSLGIFGADDNLPGLLRARERQGLVEAGQDVAPR